MIDINWSLIIKFLIIFFGLIAWIGISYYVVYEATMYFAENALKISISPGEVFPVWIVFNGTAFAFAKFWDDFY